MPSAKKAGGSGKPRARKKVKVSANTTAAPERPKATRSKVPTRKIEGLKGPQVRILDALAEGASLTRAEVAKKAKVDNASLTGYLGSLDPDTRAANDEKWHPSLISMKLVKYRVVDEGGKDIPRYEITALGKRKQAKGS